MLHRWKTNIMILLPLLVLPLTAVAISEECFEVRKTCYDQWDSQYRATKSNNCDVCEDYIECMKQGKQTGVCPNDTVIVEKVHFASQRCGLIKDSRGPYEFPEFDESHDRYHRGQSLNMLYEFVSGRGGTYDEASEFCSKAGGSLFIANYEDEFISVKTKLLSNVLPFGTFWTGLNDKAEEGIYRFEDGSELHWDFFAPDEGTNDNSFFDTFRRREEDCVSMNKEGQGFVMDCDKVLNFVCQYRGVPKDSSG